MVIHPLPPTTLPEQLGHLMRVGQLDQLLVGIERGQILSQRAQMRRGRIDVPFWVFRDRAQQPLAQYHLNAPGKQEQPPLVMRRLGHATNVREQRLEILVDGQGPRSVRQILLPRRQFRVFFAPSAVVRRKPFSNEQPGKKAKQRGHRVTGANNPPSREPAVRRLQTDTIIMGPTILPKNMAVRYTTRARAILCGKTFVV